MYKPGNLINLCLEYMQKGRAPPALAQLTDREKYELSR